MNDKEDALDVQGDFVLSSETFADGDALPPLQYSGAMGVPGGGDVSPQLTWSGAPEGTRSFVVTAYDPDAPTGSGFWHWAVADVPASVSSLPANAGDEPGEGLGEGAYQLPNDARVPRFVGAAPPAGSGAHRYVFTVHALGVEKVGVAPDATPAMLGFMMGPHVLGRASIVAIGEIAA